MGQRLHGRARTTAAVRRVIQPSTILLEPSCAEFYEPIGCHPPVDGLVA
jgi:hypothetical protein